jgi:CheY-like chemotaxis protein
LNVLVVDDDAALREVYKEILTVEGHSVRMAVDGVEGLSSLRDDIDLVIADLNMPRMSGAEFLQAMRESPQFGRIPVLVISGRPHTLPEWLQGPLTSVLRKPFRLDMLNQLVESLAGASALH